MRPCAIVRKFAPLAGLALALTCGQVAAQDIVLGQVGPFTVLPVPDAPEINQGIQAFVKQANAAGGMHGRKFNFFELDDRYSAAGFIEQFDKAAQRKPLARSTPTN